jgi:hypothetical protein
MLHFRIIPPAPAGLQFNSLIDRLMIAGFGDLPAIIAGQNLPARVWSAQPLDCRAKPAGTADQSGRTQ